MTKKIFMTIPAFCRNGGIRVILEWANRLAKKHEVTLQPLSKEHSCSWFEIDPSVTITHKLSSMLTSDLLIVTSPHSVDHLKLPYPKKRVVFLQMMEHLFFGNGNSAWMQKCQRTYLTQYPIITVSQWGMNMMHGMGRRAPTHYVGNGVNLDHFPISDAPKDGKTVLVEGWLPGNQTKDTSHYAPAVAAKLRSMGFQILAYSAMPMSGTYNWVPHEYHCQPDLATLNKLYERATILIKASHCDFRSCSPMEAMTKGTVTARAIRQGDDDLVHHVNCLRGPYEFHTLFANSLLLLNDDPLRKKLAAACLHHVQTYNWDYWMEKIETILWSV